MKVRNRKCFIATTSECFTSDVLSILRKTDRELPSSTATSRKELLEELNEDDDITIISDRFYFGIQFEKEIKRVFQKAPRSTLVMAMYGECPKSFAYRMYKCSVNTLVTHMEDRKAFHRIMRNLLFSGIEYYPEHIREGIHNREHIMQAELSRPVTEREELIIRRLASGKTLKEIGKETNCAASTIASHMYKFRKKVGAANNIEAVRICLLSGILPTQEGTDYDGQSRWDPES